MRRHRYGNPDANQADIFDFAAKRLDAEVRNTTAVGRGFPDGALGWRGLTILAEVKRPGKKKALRESQEEFRRQWKGGPILTVESSTDLLEQIVGLDRLVPPVRGLPGQMAVDEAISKAVTAIEAQRKLEAVGVVLPSGYTMGTRAILEDLVRALNGRTVNL